MSTEPRPENQVTDLYLSGGGFRAPLGGAGAIAYLDCVGEWSPYSNKTDDDSSDQNHTVERVLSVSGGSLLNGALIADGSEDVQDVLNNFVGRLLKDSGRFFATRRRAIAVTEAFLSVVALASLVVLSLRSSALLALIMGLGIVPAAVFVFRRLFSAVTLDLARVAVDNADRASNAVASQYREHIICTTGMTTGLPHYVVWSQDAEGSFGWGNVHRGRVKDADEPTIGALDAVFASSSLPGAGRFKYRSTNPAIPSEVLVDGGASGIFGDAFDTDYPHSAQLRKGLVRRRTRSDYCLAIDAGRHIERESTAGRALRSVSFISRLGRWLKLSLDATYVNDLVDFPQKRIVRLSTTGYLSRNAPLPSLDRFVDRGDPFAARLRVHARVDELRRRTARLGLRGLNPMTAANALLTGVLATAETLEPLKYDERELTESRADDLVKEVGKYFGMACEFQQAWDETASCLFFETQPRPIMISHAGVAVADTKENEDEKDPCPSKPYRNAVDAGFSVVQLDVATVGHELRVEHHVFGRRLPFWPTKPGPLLSDVVDDVLAHAGESKLVARFNIEVKSRKTRDLLSAYLMGRCATEKVGETGCESEIEPVPWSTFCVSAPFHPGLLRHLRREHPRLATNEALVEGAAYGRPIPLLSLRSDGKASGCQLWSFVARWDGVMRSALDRGRFLQIYVVNDEGSADYFEDRGVHGLITDNTKLGKRYVPQ